MPSDRPLPLGAVRLGSDAWLLRVDGAEQAASLATALRHGALRCSDVVPAATTVLVDGVEEPDELWRIVEGWDPTAVQAHAGELVEVPVIYDGADLDRVAAHWGVDVGGVVARHTGLEFVATFSGFAPGFSYLSGLPAEWAVPRLASPRSRVPAGSVALADRWCGIYPSESPGGWSLLGRTELAVWDLGRGEAPALLVPGARVRFVVA
ncbi:5-oxoprolinase subunit B family protein [Nocardioides jishulii]|uniref:5-oxoprolinase subunit B family protein n=1 Tax=Nocardioides jishulii TaxID=2575440 RepID=UPI001EEFE53A|nr:carboxyltransferase domain-containing protein [Nocardioides jishulii]